MSGVPAWPGPATSSRFSDNDRLRASTTVQERNVHAQQYDTGLTQYPGGSSLAPVYPTIRRPSHSSMSSSSGPHDRTTEIYGQERDQTQRIEGYQSLPGASNMTQSPVDLPRERLAEWRQRMMTARPAHSEPVLQQSHLVQESHPTSLLAGHFGSHSNTSPAPPPPHSRSYSHPLAAVTATKDMPPHHHVWIAHPSPSRAPTAGQSSIDKPAYPEDEQAQHASAQAESERLRQMAQDEERLLTEALQASTLESEQQERERAQRQATEDAELLAALEHSRQDKGKAVETDEQMREREELEMAMALSLEESKKRPYAPTSAEMFELLSRPGDSNVVDATSTSSAHANQRLRQEERHDEPSTSLVGLLGRPFVELSDDSSQPTGSSNDSSWSSRFRRDSDRSTHQLPPTPPIYMYPGYAAEMDEPEDIVIGPGRPVPQFLPSHSPTPPSRTLSVSDDVDRFTLAIASPANLSASSSQLSLAERFEHDPSRASFMSTASNAGSFESEPYVETNLAQEHAVGGHPTYYRHHLGPEDSPKALVAKDPDVQDPFTDSAAVLESGPLPLPLPESGVQRSSSQLSGPRPPYELARSAHGTDQSTNGPDKTGPSWLLPSIATTGLPSITRTTATSSASDDTGSTQTLGSPAVLTPVEHTASPSFGGFVQEETENVLADEDVLRGIKWGFIEPRELLTHTPLEHEGDFPRAAQLSREKDDGDKMPFGAFAVEASTWQSLLVYLMWHGHSRFEAAPADLQSEKAGRGLAVDITVDLYRSFENDQPRVRVQLELLPPGITEAQPDEATKLRRQANSLDSDCPSVSIKVVDIGPLLPLPLSKLAQMLSQAHAQSRSALKSSSWRAGTVTSAAAASSSSNPTTSSSSSTISQPSAATVLAQQRELALAVDVFNRLAQQMEVGITYTSRFRSSATHQSSKSDSTDRATEAERSMMRTLKARLKNKIRKGRATGSHALSHVKPSSSSSNNGGHTNGDGRHGSGAGAEGSHGARSGRKVVELNVIRSSNDRRNDLPDGAHLITPFKLEDVAE
ncbi:hypothetical protein OIO90_002655 [Microbotryomycetes sp. JL221]|nr:hypothetical protein OIO90_002655 [Microbotryomycetes sp. JL221]